MTISAAMKDSKRELTKRKEELTKELEQVDKELTDILNKEKPFVANVLSYSGYYWMQFKTEEQARKKYEEYASKKKFKNGLNFGVFLYKYNPDGTKTLLEERKLSTSALSTFDTSKYL